MDAKRNTALAITPQPPIEPKTPCKRRTSPVKAGLQQPMHLRWSTWAQSPPCCLRRTGAGTSPLFNAQLSWSTQNLPTLVSLTVGREQSAMTDPSLFPTCVAANTAHRHQSPKHNSIHTPLLSLLICSFLDTRSSTAREQPAPALL